MKYIVIIIDKDNNASQSSVEVDTLLEAALVGEKFCFDRNAEMGIKSLSNKGGYSVLAIIGEHPLINLGVK